MKDIFVIFLIILPILFIFILYSYIKLYLNLKKTIIKNKAKGKTDEINELLKKLNKELPIIINKKSNTESNKHEVLYK